MNKQILLEQLEEGMELAQPVKNKLGQLLLPVDIKIEEKHKRLLKTWGVSSLFIKDDGKSETVETGIDEETLNKAKLLLEQRMTWKPRNSNEEELYETALGNILEKLLHE
jgi:hypothetical protein